MFWALSPFGRSHDLFFRASAGGCSGDRAGDFRKNQFSAEVLTIRVGFIQTVQQELYGV